jgi:homoserine/homoserine lactone efflux protein
MAQVLLLGIIAMIIGTLLDGAYAILAGRAGAMLTRSRIRWTERAAGTFLIGGGIWLALSRQI